MRVSPWKPAIVEMIDPLGLYHPPVWLVCGICCAVPVPVEAVPVETSCWSKILLHSCGDAPWKDPVKGLVQGNFASPLGVAQLYPLGYSPAPLLLGLPQWGRDLVVLGYAQRGNWSPQRSGGGHTSIASHGYCRCSNASYGGRCPVGQRPNSTKVEGRCLPDGWRLPRP